MRRSLRLALRCMVFVAVIALFAATLVSISSPGHSPYVSALSAVVAGSVYAAPSACGNSGCNRYGHCSKVRGTNCQYSAGECYQSAC
jgi:hypothetical protein